MTPGAFDVAAFTPEVQRLLALDGGGFRLMPLAHGECSSEDARRELRGAKAEVLFPGARNAKAALSGLWLYFSCLDESHTLSQSIADCDGSFWHGIMHRQEPDPGNSGYWFRRVGEHPVFPALRMRATELAAAVAGVAGFGATAERWDPFAFIDFCERARSRPGSLEEGLAMEIQRAEWQLLFGYCASGK
jgi:hypothetical protein